MFITPDSSALQYCGRLDDTDKTAPVMIFPCSYVKIRFTGSKLAVVLENRSAYWDNYMGYLLDGEQDKILLAKSGKRKYEIKINQDNTFKEHEFMLFKRMDACHHVTFYGFELAKEGRILDLPKPSQRRIEVYGDSVSAGEVSEAIDYVGKEDPTHNGEYSNSWYSYAWLTARRLDAQIHDIAQGGIALLDQTGWFCEPRALGMESVWDKARYNPALGSALKWDFRRYTPHVVIVAIGQNDSHPYDYMAKDFNSAQSHNWRRHYLSFLKSLRAVYPDAWIICCTTLLCHEKAWDDAIDLTCRDMGDEKVTHFIFQRGGAATPGHLRIPEAEEMAEELSAYIERLGIFHDTE